MFYHKRKSTFPSIVITHDQKSGTTVTVHFNNKIPCTRHHTGLVNCKHTKKLVHSHWPFIMSHIYLPNVRTDCAAKSIFLHTSTSHVSWQRDRSASFDTKATKNSWCRRCFTFLQRFLTVPHPPCELGINRCYNRQVSFTSLALHLTWTELNIFCVCRLRQITICH